MLEHVFNTVVIVACMWGMGFCIFYLVRPYVKGAMVNGWPAKGLPKRTVPRQVSVSEHELEHLLYSGLEVGGEVIYGALWDEDTFKEKHGEGCEKCYPKETLQQMEEDFQREVDEEYDNTDALWHSQTITYQRPPTYHPPYYRDPRPVGGRYTTPGGVKFIYRIDDQNRTIVNYGDGDKQLTIFNGGHTPIVGTDTISKIVSVTDGHDKGTLEGSLGSAWSKILREQVNLEDVPTDELLGGTAIASISDTTPKKAPKIPITTSRGMS